MKTSRRHLIIGVAATATLAGGAALAFSVGQNAGDPPTPGLTGQARLADLAGRMAMSNGEPNPASRVVFHTTMGAAEGPLQGGPAVVDKAAPVDLVVQTGHFTATQAKVPSTAEAPTGRVLWTLVDPATGEVRGWGVTNVPLDKAAELGVAEPLP